MKLSLTLISGSFLVAIANAATIHFNVVAPNATDVKVSVNGEQVALNAAIPHVPYYTGSAEVGSATTYKYITDSKEETFERSLSGITNTTLNDFFDRPVTYANLPQLPWPIEENPQWTRSGKKPEIFDDNYIPSIFFHGDDAEVNTLVRNVTKQKVKGDLTFIGSNYVHTFKKVKFAIHGAGKKHNNAKQSWRWTLHGDDTLGNRNYFKLRHMEEDPTQIRERIYADILHAMGTYANEATMVRLFMNGQGFGTFNMLDDVTQFSYINAMFYGGKPPSTLGPLYDGATGADFQYHPGNIDGYASWKANKKNVGNVRYEAFEPLCKAWNETDYTDNTAVANFEKMFDTEHFLRFMVIEYLTAHWDGYWMGQTNDAAYRDPTENDKWYFIDQDFDATFGVNLAEPEAKEFLNIPYKDFPNRYPAAVMANGLLKNPDKQAKFEKYLTETVRVLFNNVTLTQRVTALHEFLAPDLLWDRSLVQQSPGTNFGWTYEQTSENLWRGVDAPNANGGGAAWGLIEYIAAKSQAMAKLYNIDIVTEPVGPPAQNATEVVPSTADITSNTTEPVQSPIDSSEQSKTTSIHLSNSVSISGASTSAPQALLAIFTLAIAAFIF
ncbi:coth protein-domain-containing protein [Sporodiniella umbellata]|nr:coth protein-domain-containing protein [Sporodiniella umbellata]